ncbi:hypothetical protein [Symbiopectobacterium sp.]|uniref:hypothetical protein n=1 Tax=Symbiopectobacterium sp. TaxID=2952789 RepID=UPI003F688E63
MAAARSILFGHCAEATIVLSGSPPQEFIELAQLNGQPLIVIGRNDDACDSVHIDNDTAARTAARLFAADGRKQVALIQTMRGALVPVRRCLHSHRWIGRMPCFASTI